MTMRELLGAIDKLGTGGRRRVLLRLRARTTHPVSGNGSRKPTPRGLIADRQRESLDRLLALAGTVRSKHRDVSSNKYKHLGEIYAPRP